MLLRNTSLTSAAILFVTMFFSLSLLAGCGTSNSSFGSSTTPSPAPTGNNPSGSGSSSAGNGSGGGGGTGGTSSSAPTQAQFLYGSSGQGVKAGRIESTGQIVSVPMPTDSTTGITHRWFYWRNRY